jgi:hypothetical protein
LPAELQQQVQFLAREHRIAHDLGRQNAAEIIPVPRTEKTRKVFRSGIKLGVGDDVWDDLVTIEGRQLATQPG